VSRAHNGQDRGPLRTKAAWSAMVRDPTQCRSMSGEGAVSAPDGQLKLFAEASSGRMNKAEAGIAKEGIGKGAEFASPTGKVLNLDNWRRRVWAPAIEASGARKPARIYDLRSTFASNALAAGISVFELARVMGTSVQMIERHYGALLDGAGAGIAARLDAFDNKGGEGRQEGGSL
jgi:hypothetical protein